jgi:hypothetical protein
MTDDLEPRLRARLDRLARAVPIPPDRALRPVVSIAPRWRGGSGDSGPGGLVAIGLALVLVFGAAYLVGGSKSVEGGVSDSKTDGMFELSIRSPRDRYAEDEPIDVVATLEYIGEDPSIEAFSYPNMPGFGVEQLDGPYRVGGSGGRASCVTYPFRRGELVTYPFAKSAAFAAGDPDEAFIRAYLNLGSDGRIDPILRLPAGTWRIFTIADLYVGGCGGSEHRLEAGITVVVGAPDASAEASTSAAPARPPPTPFPSPSPTVTASPTMPPPQVAVPYPDGCAAYHLSERRCAYIVDWAKDEAGIHRTDSVTIELLGDPDCFDPDPRTCGGVRTTSFIVRVRLTTPAGASSDHPVFCGLGGETSLLCTERPRIWTTTSTNGYTDVPCETENGPCATPLPTIDPAAAAAAVPLEVDALDIVIDHVGAYSIPVGEAVLPNGILSDVQFGLADDMPSTVLLKPGFINLEVTSLDGGPRFDNIYQHGWHEGTERVQVTLTFTVDWMDADTTLHVTNIRVH